MKPSSRRLLAATALVTFAAAAGAHPDDPASWIDQRQARQHSRIAHGVESGALTPHEWRWLQHEQRRIARFEHFARADGWLDRGERRRLHAMLDRSSRHIARQTHDGQPAVGGGHDRRFRDGARRGGREAL